MIETLLGLVLVAAVTLALTLDGNLLAAIAVAVLLGVIYAMIRRIDEREAAARAEALRRREAGE